ncbi:MAG: PKD domain-containing protein [Thermoplasmata archaeon]|nr:PKD domain-containing protein [Thermoplasmata archaeon]
MLVLLAGSGLSVAAAGGLARPAQTPSHASLVDSAQVAALLAEARHSLDPSTIAQSAPHAVGLSPGGYLWTNVTTAVSGGPSARAGAAMAYDPSDGYVLLFGGTNSISVLLGDTWSFQNGTWTNLTSTVNGTPPARLLGVLAYDPASRGMILFGGHLNGGTLYTSATWGYHHGVWTNLTSTVGTPPSGRIYSVMVTDSTDSQILLYGGTNNGGSSFLTDTWLFKGGGWINVTSLAGSSFGRLLYPVGSDDPADHGVLVMALYPSGTGAPCATLIYSGGSWRNITSTLSPLAPDLVYEQLAYLPSIASVVATGGYLVNSTASVWPYTTISEFASGGWSNVTAEVAGPPLEGIYSGIAVNPTDGSLLLFGGIAPSSTVSSAAWLFSAPPKVTATANRAVVDQGTSVSFTGGVTLGAAPYAFHWNFGDGSTATTLSGVHGYPRPGTFTANLTVTDLVGHSVTTSVSIVVNAPLSLSASATPSIGTANSTVALTSALSGGTAPYAYHWSLGDGSTATASSLGHVYSKAGNYSVTANVTDALGDSASTTFTLQVNAVPHTSSSAGSVSLTSGTGLYLLLGIVLLAIVVVALAVMLGRRPKGPQGPPTQYHPGPGAPPPTGVPTSVPPAAWSEAPPPPPR